MSVGYNEKPTRTQVVKARVFAALGYIEEAQRNLAKACQALCSIRGMSPDWKRISKLHRRVENEWYHLDGNRASKLQKCDLDHEPDKHDEEWLK